MGLPPLILSLRDKAGASFCAMFTSPFADRKALKDIIPRTKKRRARSARALNPMALAPAGPPITIDDDVGERDDEEPLFRSEESALEDDEEATPPFSCACVEE